ncbi:MAG: hypothetical protein VYE22_20505 [Myxococcota bacterium]|nr:hypothetical protein [Myxococcota bacterium]
MTRDLIEILRVLHEFGGGFVLKEPHHIDAFEEALEALNALDPARVSEAARAYLDEAGDEAESRRRWLIATVVFANRSPRRAIAIDAAVIDALADAVMTPDDEGFRFAACLPPGQAPLWMADRVVELAGRALHELHASADPARAGRGAVLSIERIAGVFREPSFRADGDLVRGFGVAIAKTVDALFDLTVAARPDASEVEAWHARLATVLRAGWIRVLPGVARRLGELTDDPAVAARLLDHWLDAGSEPGARLARFGLAERAGRPDVMADNLPPADERDRQRHQLRIADAYLAAGRREEAVRYLEKMPEGYEQKKRLEALGVASPTPKKPAASPKPPGPTFEAALEAGDPKAAARLLQPLHPDALQRLLAAHEVPTRLRNQMYAAAVQYVTGSPWDPEDTYRAILALVEAAVAEAPKKRTPIRERFAKQLDELSYGAPASPYRQAMYRALDELQS